MQALADKLGADGRGVAICQVVPFPYAPDDAVVSECVRR